MAARIGVPDEVIRKARARISEDDTRLENLLKQVEADTQQACSGARGPRRGACRGAGSRGARLKRRSGQRRMKPGSIKVKGESGGEGSRGSAPAEAPRTFPGSGAGAGGDQKDRPLSRSRCAKARTRTAEQDHDAPAELPIFIPATGCGSRGGTGRQRCLRSERGLLELEVDGKKLKLPHREVMPIEPLRGQTKRIPTPGWSADLS